MGFVASNQASDAGGATTVDVVINVGTTSGRKAMIQCVAQDGEIQTMAVGRDPTGTNEAANVVRAETVFNDGDAYYHMTEFYLDLSVTGSQTFRVTYNGSPEKLGISVLVHDGMAAGAPEAQAATEFTSAGTVITDDLLTVAANALLVSSVMMRTSTNETADPWYTADEGQTVREDEIIDARVEWARGDLVVATPATTDMGWTGTSSAQCGIQILTSYAPAASGVDVSLGVATPGATPVALTPVVAGAAVDVALGVVTAGAAVVVLTKEPRALLSVATASGDPGSSLGVIHSLVAVGAAATPQDLTAGTATLAVALGAATAAGAAVVLTVEPRAALGVAAASAAPQALAPEPRAYLAEAVGGATVQALAPGVEAIATLAPVVAAAVAQALTPEARAALTPVAGTAAPQVLAPQAVAVLGSVTVAASVQVLTPQAEVVVALTPVTAAAAPQALAPTTAATVTVSLTVAAVGAAPQSMALEARAALGVAAPSATVVAVTVAPASLLAAVVAAGVPVSIVAATASSEYYRDTMALTVRTVDSMEFTMWGG